MTVEQLEERLMALEDSVVDLRAEVKRLKEPDGNPESVALERDEENEDRLSSVDYDFVPNVAPKEVRYYRGTLVSTKPGPTHLSMTEQEWDAFGREENNE